MAADAGADCVGLVVEYPVAVPWNLSREEAAELMPLILDPAPAQPKRIWA